MSKISRLPKFIHAFMVSTSFSAASTAIDYLSVAVAFLDLFDINNFTEMG